MAAEGSTTPQAFVVVHAGSRDERHIPVYDRIFIGRECPGIDDKHRLLVDDPEVSRNHVEVRLDAEQDQAYLIDTSTNGTRLNGSRVERAVPVPVRSGDRITVGQMDLAFRSQGFLRSGTMDTRQTAMRIILSKMAMVVGDITNYSTITQYTDSNVVAESLQKLFQELRALLTTHTGTLCDYAGDAVFAIWETDQIPDAPKRAVAFALDAGDLVARVGQDLPLSTPDGSTISMGWAVVLGEGAVSSMTGSLVSVVGDATNLAFRLSGFAARKGRAPVLVTEPVREALGDEFEVGQPEEVETKGRTGTEKVYGVYGRAKG